MKKLFCMTLILLLSFSTLSACRVGKIWYDNSSLKSKSETCAKQIISENLRSPDTAQWHELSYMEHNRGKYIVYVDVSAQNAFGGWVRARYFVCVQFKENDWKSGAFYHHSISDRLEANSKNDLYTLTLLKNLNDYYTDDEDDPAEPASEVDLVLIIICAVAGVAVVAGVAYIFGKMKETKNIEKAILATRKENGDDNTVVTTQDYIDYRKQKEQEKK
ncbi:MAG: hypothetical protein FWE84_06125 [Firmicutes bacterium]|nr:hypothetical protein [Bacillota bacterium]